MGDCSPGRGKYISSLVDGVINNQPVPAACIGKNLPESNGALFRAGMGEKRAFGNGHIFEIFRHVVFRQHFFNIRQISAGALQPENYLGSISKGQ